MKKTLLPIALLCSLTSCGEIASSISPVCNVVDGADTADFSNFDYGVKIGFTVFNSGASGQVKLIATLFTSEGDFSQEKEFLLKENESRKIDVLFPQPTVDATNMSYQGSCGPA